MKNPFAVPWSTRLREGGGPEMAMSALLHGALLFVFAGAMASLDVSEREELVRPDVDAMRGYLRATAGHDEDLGEALSDGRPGLGDPREAEVRRAAPAANPGRARERRSEIAEATNFGIIGLVSSSALAAPASVWESEDGESVLGSTWGDAMDGRSDLLLSGGGQGGGGRGEGIGLGRIGTIGRCGDSTCVGTGQGWAGAHGAARREHEVRTISIRCGTPVQATPSIRTTCQAQVNGRLMPEVIQRIVHQNHGRFRACYEAGLATSPSLEGRVEVKFVIARDGSVATASDGASDLPDAAVRACVVRAFAALSFPQPEGGIVTVVYPLVFSVD
jgi:hypothetical protein